MTEAGSNANYHCTQERLTVTGVCGSLKIALFCANERLIKANEQDESLAWIIATKNCGEKCHKVVHFGEILEWDGAELVATRGGGVT